MSVQIVEGKIEKKEQVIVPGRINGYYIRGILGGGKYGLVLEVSEREENRLFHSKDSYALKVVFCSVDKSGKFVRHDLDVSKQDISNLDFKDNEQPGTLFGNDHSFSPSSPLSPSEKTKGSSSGFQFPSVMMGDSSDSDSRDHSISLKNFKRQFNRFCGNHPTEMFSVLEVRNLFQKLGFAATRFNTLLQEVITNLNIDFSKYNQHYANLLTFRDYWVEVSRVDPETKMATEFCFFLLMEKCKGTLMEYLDAGKCLTLSTYERYFILAEIATGLSILHSNGIAHGDLHVGNILWREVELNKPNKLTKEKAVTLFCIGDFGRAKYFKHKLRKKKDGHEVWWTKLSPEKRDIFFFYNLLLDVFLPRERKYKIYLNEYKDILRMMRHFAYGRKEIEQVPGFEPLYKLVKRGGVDLDVGIDEIAKTLKDIIQNKLKKNMEVTKKLAHFGNADYFFSLKNIGEYHAKKHKKEKKMREKLMKKLKVERERAEEKQMMMELEKDEEERKRILAEEKLSEMVLNLIKMGVMTDDQIMGLAKIGKKKLQELKGRV